MRSRIAAAALLLGLAVAAGSAVAEGLHMPQYETVTLDNGLTLLVMRHPVVPIVAFDVWIDAGAAVDAPGSEGLAGLTLEALRKGAGDRDAAAFAEALDYLGADFSTSVNLDRARVRLNLLSKDFDAGLGLLADAILRPRFDAAEVRKLADQMAEQVVQAKDNPRNVLADYHRAFLYGEHPYGNPVDGTEKSFAALGDAEVKRFHHDHYGADRVVLAVTGDIDPAAVKAKITQAFSGMPKAAGAAKPLPAPVWPTANRVLLVNKVDTPQTWFQIGSLGPDRYADDFVAAELVRTVFGGRFTSWLNQKLRIDTGLTYGARYTFNPGRVAGAAYVMTFTATETTKQAVDIALEQLKRLHEEGLGDADLASAKAYMKGQSPYDYETAVQLAGVIAELKFYGRDRSEVDDLFRRIDAVDAAACRAVIDKYFAADKLVFTAVGVADEVRGILGSYGELTVRENGDPGFRP